MAVVDGPLEYVRWFTCTAYDSVGISPALTESDVSRSMCSIRRFLLYDACPCRNTLKHSEFVYIVGSAEGQLLPLVISNLMNDYLCNIPWLRYNKLKLWRRKRVSIFSDVMIREGDATGRRHDGATMESC